MLDQAFVGSSGWCFVFFPAISLRMPFKNNFAIWGLIFGPCFCRNPFLWRAIDFEFLLSRFRYFLWLLKFLLLLLLCFSTSLLFYFSAFLLLCFSTSLLFYFSAFLRVCSFVLCLYACPAFPLFCFFLLFCFSAFLASLCSASLFFCFLFFLLRCFSTSLPFYFYLSFSAVMHFHDISNKDKNTQTIPIFCVAFSRV